MKVIQCVISRTNAVIGQTAALLQNDFPGRAFLVEDVITNTVLSLIRVRAFGSDATDLINQQITNVAASFSCQNLALGLAIDFPEVSRHLLKRFDPVCQKPALVIRKNDQLGMVKAGDLFRL